ncbi:DUF2017 family protein [Xylanimonas ulmi]|uniref:Uncharacterized protein DUF2017 n=1 Tax=Xylanimonas ulmi TaxID=228973 RepID=A0A4Q7M1D2_9MICO|nr:DUF2017 family protein [Xylanibacterium ulmi]RZS61625.1 uncharacterized protein DUF2017 [Xylanibacterium ulmi]
MTPFAATPEGYEAYWEEAERRVLAIVAREVSAMLREQAGLPEPGDDPLESLAASMQTTGTPRVPDDAAARRLLPDASRDDAEVAAEFRHLTQNDLAVAKVRGLERFADLLDPPGDARLDDALDEAFDGARDDDARDDAFEDEAFDDEALDDEAFDDEAFDEDAADRAVVLIGRDEANTVAAALTDVRLVVAQRLGLATDDDVEALHDEVLADAVGDDVGSGLDAQVRRYWGGVFVASGFAQESLVSAMLDDLRERRG